ncbi:MAG TPA: serine/threonine-protein kinase [Kofleriaceae bacterium]|nr:serine/threonine-protein kinase [Kofleriaceae bacterium]
MSREAAIAAGTRAGDFELLAPIAEGGFGQVYRARHAGSGRVAAVKVLHGDLCNAPGAVARFLREAEVMVRIRHPAVVELLACGTVEDGRPYLAMELLEGVDLARVLARESRLSPARVIAVLEPVAAALAAAHAQSVIHRDVKASNVFIAEDAGGERVILLDFGIAKLALPDATDLTTSRQAVGTPVTMAPEQIAGGTVDARTDVYGLGVLAFHLLTGRLPFEDESHTVVQYLHAHARRPRASAFAPLPTEADDAITRAMAIDPAQRFADPLAFVAALRSALAEPTANAALEPRAAAGILVEVRADPDVLAEPDDALLTDLDNLLPLAESLLDAAGYTPAVQGGNLTLWARPLPESQADDNAEPAAREAAVQLARQIATALDARPDRDPRVGFVVVAHAAVALCDGNAIRAGDLCDVAHWSPDPDLRGPLATEAALDGLPITTADTADSRVRTVR